MEQTQVTKNTPMRVSAIKNAIVDIFQMQLEDIDCEGFLSKDDLSGLFSKKEQPLMLYQQYMEGLQHMVQEEIFALEKKVIHALAASL